MKLIIFVTELARNRWVIFKLGDYLGVQFGGKYLSPRQEIDKTPDSMQTASNEMQ